MMLVAHLRMHTYRHLGALPHPQAREPYPQDGLPILDELGRLVVNFGTEGALPDLLLFLLLLDSLHALLHRLLKFWGDR